MSLTHHSIDLNLLAFKNQIITKVEKGKLHIYDPIRKKYLVLQPEEFVRQLTILWLISTGISRNSIQVEKSIYVNGLTKRFDIVVYNKNIAPLILVECKAPDVKVTQRTFDQIAAYQMALNAPYLLVSNGESNFIAQLNHSTQSYQFFDSLPEW